MVDVEGMRGGGKSEGNVGLREWGESREGFVR